MSFLIFPREEITSSGGKGGDSYGSRRRPFRHGRNDTQNFGNRGEQSGENRGQNQRSNDRKAQNQKSSDHRQSHRDNYERPKWTPPRIPNTPLPAPDCPCCGKPIRDIASAFNDRETGKAAHFDCIISKIAQNEILDKGDIISYIGGGRFGIVRFNNPSDPKKFTIKKILEWENKDDRPDWRTEISDLYSLT